MGNCSFSKCYHSIYFQASPSSLVSDVKEQVEALMSIPVADQKLLFKGKALQGAYIIIFLLVCYKKLML